MVLPEAVFKKPAEFVRPSFPYEPRGCAEFADAEDGVARRSARHDHRFFRRFLEDLGDEMRRQPVSLPPLCAPETCRKASDSRMHISTSADPTPHDDIFRRDCFKR